MNFLRSIARQNASLVVLVLALVGLREFTACSHQLTVAEAEASLTASCVVLAQVMTVEHPKEFDSVVRQVCQPGRTRAFIERTISQGATARGSLTPDTEYFDVLDGSGTPSPLPGSGPGSSPSPEPRAQSPEPSPSSPDAGALRK